MSFAKGILLFFCIILLAFSSCRHPITKPIPIVESKNIIEINNDVSELSTNVTFYHAAEMPVYDFHSDKNEILQELAPDPFLFLKCASIVPAEWQDMPYHITDAKICGEYAMVCSQAELDVATLFTVIYLANPKVPAIVSQAYLPHRYAYHFDFNDDALFISETVDIDYFEDFESSSVIERIELNNFVFASQDTMVESKFESITDILLDDDDLFIASTNKNFLQIMDSKN